MARIKPAVPSRKRRKKILNQAKGFTGGRRKLIRNATETLHRAWAFAFRDRKDRKRLFRRLWIARVSAGAKMNGLSYSKMINGLKKANVELNRKMLSEIAIHRPDDFARLVDLARGQ
jgi:large subunit ribosomal protein L20